MLLSDVFSRLAAGVIIEILAVNDSRRLDAVIQLRGELTFSLMHEMC